MKTYCNHGNRSGQTLIFMVMVLLILTFIVLFQLDLHQLISNKNRARNGGDAAALQAARWQGITLNLIGELNMLQAVTLTDQIMGDPDAPDTSQAISSLQARLCYVGPLLGFSSAQQAAKNNGIYVNDDFTSSLYSRADVIESEYYTRFSQPYDTTPGQPTAWDEYAAMLYAIADQGVAVDAENAQWYNDFTDYSHYLLNPDFYDAVSSQNWCWFLMSARGLLSGYNGWQNIPDLPPRSTPNPLNSEIFGLGLYRLSYLDQITDGDDEFFDLLEEKSNATLDPQIRDIYAQWQCYRPDSWHAWTDSIPEGFPFDGKIKDRYNYQGSDAAVRVNISHDRMSPGGGTNVLTWTAAAKPFGYLDTSTGKEVPSRHSLVFPVFDNLRLIPLDASTAPVSGSRAGWGIHVHEHLDSYLTNGPAVLHPDCWYCQQLLTWESYDFRQMGIDWLEENQDDCVIFGVSPSGSGGTRRGH